jgi:spermidine/putrescine transport system permease protein
MKRAFNNKPKLAKVAFWVTIAFLFAPLAVLAFYSFNASKSFTWTGFSLRWYEKLFTNSPALWDSVGKSLLIAIGAASVATVIGTLGAIGINWYKFRLKKYVQAISFIPLILPEVIIGVSLLIFFSSVIHMPLGMWTILIAHISFTIPFVILIVMARLSEFDYSIIEAGRDLGARESQILMRIIVPISLPGIASGFLTAFTLSLEDFVVTRFVAGANSQTLPLFIYGAVKRSVPPEVNALSVVIILFTILLVFSVRNLLKYVVGGR